MKILILSLLLIGATNLPAPPSPCYIVTLGWSVSDTQVNNGRRFDVTSNDFHHMTVDYNSPSGIKWTVYSNVPSCYVGAIYGQFHVVVSSTTCGRQWDFNHPQTP